MSVALVALFSVVVACTDDDNDGPNNPGGDKTKYGQMVPVNLTGFVTDTNGEALAGVTVSSGNSTVQTDMSGSFVLSKVEKVNGRSVVKYSKPGYFDVVRSKEFSDDDKWDVTMVQKVLSSITDEKTFDASDGGTLKTGGGMEVKLPADGFKTDVNGAHFAKKVTAEMVYVSPDDDNFSSMQPGGDLAAVRTDNSDAQLLSYGMVQVSLTDENGNKLQLEEGAKAEVTFPIPESMKKNPPSSIPLWSFNENTGLWEEDGVAVREGNKFKGQVSHFSWWNLDVPEQRGTLYCTVKDKDGKLLKNVRVRVGQTEAYTSDKGEAKCYVPAETEFDAWVESEDYGNYSPIVKKHVSGIQAQTGFMITLELPALKHVTGKIVNEGTGSVISSVWVNFGENTSKTIHTDASGEFDITAFYGYKGPATLFILTPTGDIVAKSFEFNDANYNFGEIKINTDKKDELNGSLFISAPQSLYDFPLNLNTEKLIFNRNEYNSQATLIDGRLHIYSWDGDINDDGEDYTEWEVFVVGYSPDKTEYSNSGLFRFSSSKGNTQYGVDAEKMDFLIYNNNGKIDLSFKGIGHQWGSDVPDKYAESDVFVFTAHANYLIDAQANTKRPVTKNDVPAFTPFLAETYPVGLIYSTSRWFKAAAKVLYKGDENDMKTIIGKLTNAGFQLVDGVAFDGEDYYWDAMYRKGNQYVMLNWKKDYAFNDDGDLSAYDELEAPIEMLVLDSPIFKPDPINIPRLRGKK